MISTGRSWLAALLPLAMLAACGGRPEQVLVWGLKAPPPAVPSPAAVPGRTAEIRVLSNRADLISGGDALVEVVLPTGADASAVRVDVDGRDVTSAFALRANGRYMGLVTGLAEGPNALTSWIAGVAAQRIIITNHPRGGPVFSGPQLQPWICAPEKADLGSAVDSQCNAPTRIAYVYQPRDKKPGDYQSYDPNHPPQDVVTTTTDEGHVVPYIVRVETGTLDRTIYQLAVLADPAQPWQPWAPQPGWNGKLFVPFGGGCAANYGQKAPIQNFDDQLILRHQFISRGWMGTSSGLNSLFQNCNEVLSAEAVMMQKELIEEQYGPIRHTIGRGGSGGSIQQNNIAAAYPGLLDGVVTDSTFPDAWTTFSDTLDCTLLTRYFLTVSPRMWLDREKMAAVMGKSVISSCVWWTVLYGDVSDPQLRGVFGFGLLAKYRSNLPSELRYHPVRNPGGARGGAQDFQVNIWGRRGPRHAAPLPFDNEGVQYGLAALRDGIISPEQFVDLNGKIGGLDEEGEFTPGRTRMDEATLTIYYRTSRLSDPRQLANTPMLDVRNNLNDGDIHQPYMSWVMRARLDAANGGHGNQVIWDHPGDRYKDDAVFAMDHWVSAIETDTSDLPRAQKLVRNKPAGLDDTCWVDGKIATDQAACRKAHPYTSDARIVAGGPLSSDIRKCRLKPLSRGDYEVRFTDAQWVSLQAAFPHGVCDWTQPGVGAQPSVPWLTYAAGPGGQPLGPAPRSFPIKSR